MRNSFYILILLLCFSCKKDHLLADKKILIGTWNWRSSTVLDFCLGWTDYTPESTGDTYKVVFLKKGVIQFYKNNYLLREHNIVFKDIYIQKEGIVDSHKEISFTIYLDGDKTKILYGKGTPNDFEFYDFPIGPDEECVEHSFNHFRKE